MFTPKRLLHLSITGAYPRRRWLFAAVLLIVFAAIGSNSARPAFADAPPPGPVLGGGDLFENGHILGEWEAFPASNVLGHVLYMWQGDVFVSRGLPCPSTSLSTPCYSWIQYTYNNDDPYNTGFWSPFQRGCMLLGANPLDVAEADGFSRVTDVYSAGGVFQPISFGATMVRFVNDENTGSGSIGSVDELDSACRGGPGGQTGGTTSSWVGTWTTTYGAMKLNQAGTTVTGTYESNDGRISGTVSGNVLRGTWAESPSYTPPDHAGDFQFTISADGRSFSGGWRYGSSGGFSDWTGARTSGGGSPPPPSGTGLAGIWDSRAEVWTITQSGSTFTGSILLGGGANNNGIITGTIIGNSISFSATYANSLNIAPVSGSLTLGSNGCTMTGDWHSRDGSGGLSLTKRGCTGR